MMMMVVLYYYGSRKTTSTINISEILCLSMSSIQHNYHIRVEYEIIAE
jgi:hypothetical protein